MEKGNLLNGNCFIDLNANPMQNPNEYSNSEFEDDFNGDHEKGLSLKDIEVVKDGYQWRKYGQKVTRDNPSPRAYYKCSFAPICSVKKKVQRSVDDPSLLVVTYEGKHNHHHHHHHHHSSSPSETDGVSSPGSISGDYATVPTASPDLRDPIIHSQMQRAIVNCESKEIQEFFVDQMAYSLTRIPGFTAALVSAISGRILDEEIPEP
ncbi:probable WRKY transcription factor 40 isoform X2 [Primulina huaijiensis]|uniref:probable WRKY transcription factor 40 isoform X2 n=1 Tax=Primulina huaijiensis TaxID=1492673 RepID=UPI003CC72AB0